MKIMGEKELRKLVQNGEVIEENVVFQTIRCGDFAVRHDTLYKLVSDGTIAKRGGGWTMCDRYYGTNSAAVFSEWDDKNVAYKYWVANPENAKSLIAEFQTKYRVSVINQHVFYVHMV